MTAEVIHYDRTVSLSEAKNNLSLHENIGFPIFVKKNMESFRTLPINQLIFFVRGENIILDKDIASLYGVTTGALNQAVKRNLNRFPPDFMFQLTDVEWDLLKSQNVIAKKGRGGSRSLPYAFTEHGVLMLASVLKSDVAAQASINIARAFTEMRKYLVMSAQVSAEIESLRAKIKVLETNTDDNSKALQTLSSELHNELEDLYKVLSNLSVGNKRDDSIPNLRFAERFSVPRLVPQK